MAGITAGYIYLFEMEAAQQDWNYDADAIVIGNFTEGTHYCKFKIPTRVNVNLVVPIKVRDFSGKNSFHKKLNMRYYIVQCNTTINSRTDLALIEKFIGTHCAPADSDYYLIIMYASGDYYTFLDSTDTARECCKGNAHVASTGWDNGESLVYRMRFAFRSEW